MVQSLKIVGRKKLYKVFMATYMLDNKNRTKLYISVKKRTTHHTFIECRISNTIAQEYIHNLMKINVLHISYKFEVIG